MKMELPSHKQQSCLPRYTYFGPLEDLAHIYSVIIGLIIGIHSSTSEVTNLQNT